mgnify:CR=1 FL=1
MDPDKYGSAMVIGAWRVDIQKQATLVRRVAGGREWATGISGDLGCTWAKVGGAAYPRPRHRWLRRAKAQITRWWGSVGHTQKFVYPVSETPM